ncbi:tRNA (adenosine(37)-N6)-dimethylallyltransferase MiaA [Dethiobacter alkaliphilus]|uniref:tRNA dimethylallyltransferase n=1 Tax=Dethiobacter alkaliphilus AHT 1 TaxID=555088 RepID=C0GDR2_DETAL|nr:tRNA (adenosine(37)-N6)-dimethylallyltransferase MiaA [Dethiobacter alkaliphilus]EEG78545.1 tRNA delta(2)-isopentenylpyrophosphate transferase [Dethiobacter alkaliphilus AHT 1]
MEKLLVIVGPTAVGKTAVAIEVAKKLGGEIISADSVQVYRGLDIGAAKPSREEREAVAHHLLDIVDPADNYTVADFQEDAKKAITDITNRGKLPILVGGTGLYVRAVVHGFSFSESGMDEEYRAGLHREAEQHGSQYLHGKLAAVDPEAAEKLHPNDLRRVIRALEVYRQSKRPISHQVDKTSDEPIYNTVQFGLTMPRELLYRRIEKRVDSMLDAGLVDEVRNLLNEGVPPAAKSLQSLGYKQIVAYLTGQISLEEAIRLIKRDTRRFAKRQLTWFRRDEDLIWLDMHALGNYQAAAQKISKKWQDLPQ